MKILMIIFTSSLDYDERIKKEVASLGNLNVTDISIFASEENPSRIPPGPIKIINPRFFIPNRESIVVKLLKITELFLRLITTVSYKNFDRIWLHDPIMVFILPFLKKRTQTPIIWDLHELPPDAFFKNRLLKRYFRRSAAVADVIITANLERGEFMMRENLITSFEVLENFPLNRYEKTDPSYKDQEFEDFIRERPYAYCQSATHPMRNFEALAKACVQKKQCLVVPGDRNEEYYRVRNTIPNFDDYILVLGKKPSDRLDYYLSRARFSMIFYTDQNKNNYYCAPNRLYHSLKLGIPVVVGANPPLARIIEEFKCGVMLNSYGENTSDIVDAIGEIDHNYEVYKRNAEKISGRFDWRTQEELIKKIVFDLTKPSQIN